MPVDFNDFEYAMPGEHLRSAGDYDVRTGPERLHAQVVDHQRRIADLELRLRRLECQMQPNLSHLWVLPPDLP